MSLISVKIKKKPKEMYTYNGNERGDIYDVHTDERISGEYSEILNFY